MNDDRGFQYRCAHFSSSIYGGVDGFVANIKSDIVFLCTYALVCAFIDVFIYGKKPILIFSHAHELRTEYTNLANTFTHGILKSIRCAPCSRVRWLHFFSALSHLPDTIFPVYPIRNYRPFLHWSGVVYATESNDVFEFHVSQRGFRANVCFFVRLIVVALAFSLYSCFDGEWNGAAIIESNTFCIYKKHQSFSKHRKTNCSNKPAKKRTQTKKNGNFLSDQRYFMVSNRFTRYTLCILRFGCLERIYY